MAARKPPVQAAPIPTREQWAAYVSAQIAIDHTYIPPQQLCVEDLEEWKISSEQLARVKARESTLRKKIFTHYFPSPEEGTNNCLLPDGTKMVGKYPITRKVDEVKLAALRQYTIKDWREFLASLNVNVEAVPDDALLIQVMSLKLDELVKWEPSLSISHYRELTAEQSAVFETILEVKPGSFSFELKAPVEA